MSKHLPSRQIFSLLAFLYLLTVSPASARQQLYGHVPTATAGAPLLNTLPDSNIIQLNVSLPLRNPEELQSLLKDLYDPKSFNYHHFLTPEQFTEEFGPSAEDYQTLMNFLVSNGFQIVNVHSSHMLVGVTGTVAAIRKTFHVNLNNYGRPDGSVFRSPDAEPSLDMDLPVLSITGLDNYARPSRKLHKMSNPENSIVENSRTKNGTGLGGLYQGMDFRDAYVPGLSASTNGAGQRIGLVEFNGFYLADINKYLSTCDPTFTATAPESILVDGYNGVPSLADCGPDGCDNDEVSLDIEMAMSMAPGAQVVSCEGLDPTDSNLSPASYDTDAEDVFDALSTQTPLCNQISSSWGGYGDGSSASVFAGYLNAFAAQGQSYFEAAGDNGSYVASGLETSVTDDPSLYINDSETLVGGTNLTTTSPSGSPPSISYTSETTWNDGYSVHNGNSASGGGICTNVLALPSYQTQVSMATNGGSTSWRNFPDVALTAFNVLIVSENGGYDNGVEGTSCAAPLWAGFTALINQVAQSETKGPMGFINPVLYNLSSIPPSYANDFHNIKDSSTNFYYWPSQTGPYTAVSGYNLTTGLGSPKNNLIADSINPPPTYTPTITNTPTITPTPTNTPTITNTPTPPTTTTSYAYPQPARNSQVYIVYNSPVAQQARINIYSLSGQEVDSVMDNPQASNQNRILISLQGFVPSVYFYVINGLSSGVLAKGKFLVVP
jgi:subtilase family serine protease